MCSTVGTELRTTRSFRYAKETQLDGAVSEDGVVVVLIHKQRLGACQAGVIVLLVRGEDVAEGILEADQLKLCEFCALGWMEARSGRGFSAHDGSLGGSSRADGPIWWGKADKEPECGRGAMGGMRNGTFSTLKSLKCVP